MPAEHALQGFDGARAFSADPQRSADLLSAGLEFDGLRRRLGGAGVGARRHAGPTTRRRTSPAFPGAGTVHHIAWASSMEDHEAWRERAIADGARPTPVIDRFWFRSIYFREPSGVLFEIATLGPGFSVDEDSEHLGEKLILPPFLEDRRAEIEAVLTPIKNPRARAAG